MLPDQRKMFSQTSRRGADACTSFKWKCAKLHGGRKEFQLGQRTHAEMCAHVPKSSEYGCRRHESSECSVVLLVQTEMFQMIGTQIRFNR